MNGVKLTVYMFDEGVAEFEDALLPGKLQGDDAFEQIPLCGNVPFEAKAYLQREHTTAPKWLSFFEDYLDIDDPRSLRNVHNSLLLLIKAGGRVFAISQGYGFVAINRDRLERGFGLKTTLNAIDPEKIKCCDVRNIDLVVRQTRTMLNHESRLADFDIHLDQNLVRFISGQPSDKDIGTLMQGSDSLSWTAGFDFQKLGEKCRDLFDLYSRDTYKQAFPFIDHMREVRDTALLDELEERLREALRDRESSKLMLAYPELQRWDAVEEFKVYQGYQKSVFEEIHIDAIYRFADEHDIEEILPHKVKVLPLDGDENAVAPRQDLYDYIVFETEHEECTYVLTLCKWYEVSADYLREVDAAVRAIPSPDGLVLPPIEEGEHESAYNERCADADPSLALLDKALITIEGHSRVEVCDLLSQGGHFVHVKRQSSSATLSHLFAQGSVSFTLLANYQDYRAKLLAQVQNLQWALPFDASDEGDRKSLTCVYAITAKSGGDVCDAIPFFSKVNLRTHKDTIEGMGFKVAACIVPIVDNGK